MHTAQSIAGIPYHLWTLSGIAEHRKHVLFLQEKLLASAKKKSIIQIPFDGISFHT